jgi:hypothetical protein
MKRLFQILLGLGLMLLTQHTYGQSLALTSPNGGEVWEGASTQIISWNYSNVDYIKIEYSLDNGLSWNTISASYATSALTYTWTIPAIGSNQAKVRITNTLQYTQDESNGVFTIPPPTISLVYPNGGEQNKKGSGQYVEWVSTGLANVNLKYSLDNGTNWTNIGTFPATHGYANWVVPSTATDQLLLQVSNSENESLNDISNAATSIVSVPTINPTKYYGGPYDGYDVSSSLPDALTLTSPNGGEVMYPYSTHNITWDFQDVNLINLFFSSDNGANWSSIATNVLTGTKSYSWTVVNSPSTNCLIKAIGVDNPLVDVSNAVFTISNSFVQITYPNGGETFGKGTGQYIEWDYSGVANVKLEYSTDNGTTWNNIATAAATNRYANWVSPSNAPSCLIRISDNLVPAINDVSDAAFNLSSIPTVNSTKYYGGPYDGYCMRNNRMDSVHVTSPNGGEIWMSASTQNITWNYNNVDYLTIEYTINDGATWTNIASNIPASQLSYAWNVPSTPSNICRIRIKDMYSNLVDISDEAFIIPNGFVQLLYPNGGESFGKGTGQYVEWNSDVLANIKLDYSIDNGTTWNVIGTFPGANKYANWVCPQAVSNQVLMRISDPSGSGIYVDQSNLTFQVIGVPTVNPTKYYGGPYDGYSMYNYLDQYVKVIKPNGGEIWGNGTTQQIKWATLNNNENLRIEFTTDNEATWTTLLNDVPNTPVIYNWNIAATPSNTCKVRATTMSGLEVDKSDNFFTIANPNGIETEDIAGNNFCPSQTFNVNFNESVEFNFGNQFIVQLSDSIGNFDGELVNIGSITATTPAPIPVTIPDRYYTSNFYRLRVIGTNPPTIGTDNGINFTINALPLVNLGNDVTLCNGNSQTLNATNTGATYLWSNGATTPTITVNQAGTYHVAVTNSCGVSRDTVVVDVLSPPVVNLGPDLQICQNAAVTLTADSGATSYQWSTGAITRSIQAVLSGNYVVYASNQCGTTNDNINISYLPTPTIDLGNDQGLCPGSQVVLNANTPNASYLWSTGATTSTLTVTQPGTYWVNVTTQCGVISDQVSIYNGGFTLNAGTDVQLCDGQTASLQATGANSYSWSTGQTSSGIQVSPIGTTTYTVTATNIYNCSATDQVVVYVNANPAVPSVTVDGSTTYCNNETRILSTSIIDGISRQWLRNNIVLSGATQNTYQPTSTATYQLRVTNGNGCTALSTPMGIVVNLLQTTYSNIEAEGSYVWPVTGLTYAETGLYISNVSCAIDTLNLTITGPQPCDDGDPCTINDVSMGGVGCAGTFADSDNDGTCDANDLCQGPEPGTACNDNNACTVNDVIQDNCTCVGTFADADNDGTCDANDLCQGAEPGTTCDDGDACTVNDVIQDNCTCAGVFSDADNDGTCDANDLCQGAEPGATCDDGDACTVSDVIQDNCTCAGVVADADNDGTCDANDLCQGAEPGATCDDGDACTVSDVIHDNCTCAGTFADADNDATCDANDLCQGAEPGTTCDDGDACTENDVIEDNCTCAGIFADSDNDGTCDANDLCQGAEPGTTCDDGDACTENDVIQDNCTCAGQLLDANNDGVCDLNSISGCTDVNACNYNAEANMDDNSCVLPQPEICNGLDDDCNGQIDEGLTPASINAVSVTTASYPSCTGNAIKSANLTTGTNSSLIEGSGPDLWYSFTAQRNTLRVSLSAAFGDNSISLFTVNNGCLNLILEEHEVYVSSNSSSGNQILLTDQLNVGQDYFVAVHQVLGPTNTGAKVCFTHLNESTCDHYFSNYTGIYTNVCSSFKAQYRANANNYIFNVLSCVENSENVAITPWSYTSPSSNSIVPRLGSLLPCNQSGNSRIYSLSVSVIYTLMDAAGNVTNLLSNALTNCSVVLNSETSLSLRLAHRCPTLKSITSTIDPSRTVCGAMRYDWEFTEVLPTPGAAQVVQGGAYASVFFLSNVPGITVGKTYNVRVRPVHSSGTVGQWGSVQCLRVGTSGMIMQSESESDWSKESRVSSISIYPNPTSTSSFVLQYNGLRMSELTFAPDATTEPTFTEELVMMDITGKVVFKTNVVVSGGIVEIEFGYLASGVYMVMVGEERLRLVVGE